MPCGTLTGWPTVETRIETTNTGAVIYEPALVGGPLLGGAGHVPGWGRLESMARTFDDGATWDTFSVAIYPDTYLLDAAVDNNLYVDHDTGRLFAYFYNATPLGTQTTCVVTGGTIAFSDNDGTNWSPGFDLDHGCAENPTILTAVPRTSTLAGYRNVVYLCGDNTSTGVATLGTPGFSCSKSADGGAHWLGTTLSGLGILGGGQGFYSGVAKDLLNPYPECAGGSSSAGAGVQPLPDGTLLVVMSCGSKTYLAKSTDEGATWNVKNEIPHGGSLRADSVGNLYLLRANGAGGGLPLMGSSAPQLFLSHSTDGGASWSPELDVIAPGVISAGTTFFAQGTYQAGEVGHVAVMYYGIRGGNTTSDGFITETRDALDPNPLFWSGQVNSPTRPLLYNNGPLSNIGVTVLDFIGGALSHDDRSVWASFVQDCGDNMFLSPECQRRWPGTNPGDPQDGFASRLVWPLPQ